MKIRRGALRPAPSYELVKMNMQKFAGRGLRSLLRNAGWARLGLLCLAGWMINAAHAQPTNDNFASPTVISGTTGTTSGSNVGATLELPCEPNALNVDDQPLPSGVGASVWYAWTATASGTASFNTVGSGIDTVLSIWTTTNPAGGLCDPSVAMIVADDQSGGNGAGSTSALTFTNVVAGTTYYVNVEGYDGGGGPATGSFVLNWNEVPALVPTISSGAFRVALDPALGGIEVVSMSDSTPPAYGIITNGIAVSTVAPSVLGARVTVTRTGGSSGRALVDYTVGSLIYTNIFRTNYYGTNILTTSIYSTTNSTVITNIYFTFTTILASNSYEYFAGGYQYFNTNNAQTNGVTIVTDGSGNVLSSNNVTGSLLPTPTNGPPFNLSGTNRIFPPLPPLNTGISITIGPDYTNTVISVTNVFQLASVVSNQYVPSGAGISPASGTLTFNDYQMSEDFVVPVFIAVGPDFPILQFIPSLAAVTLSNPRLDPQESADLIPPTVAPNGGALISALNPDFGLPFIPFFNFERSTFRVNENVNFGQATVAVTLSIPQANDTKVNYRIDFWPNIPNSYNFFPLQAGSDYATPTNDFASVTGTLTFPKGETIEPLTIPIVEDSLVEFNEDMRLEIYWTKSNSDPTVGEINYATLTILGDDQPAGAVDRNWNKNNASDSNPPFIDYPGTTGNGGTVYAVAEQPDGKAVIAGSFNSFDQNTYGGIVRTMTNGYQDPNFLVYPNSGANDFIAALAIQPDGKIIIGGNFTSFNGNNRHHIARLNTDGTLDATFNPGLGADGMVWSVALENSVQVVFGISITNTQVIIGGDFATVNGVNLNRVARLNANGSVDTSFNPGVGPNGTVNDVALDALGRVIIGGDFDMVSGVNSGGVARLSVDGSLDTTFAPGIGTYNSDTLATDPIYALAVQPNGQILIAGGFSYLDLDSYNGIARLNTDGTVDLSFTPGTGTLNPVTGFSDTIYAMMLQPDGNILIGGDFTTFNQTRRVGVARLFTNGSVDTSFMDTAYNQFAGLINNYHNPDAVNDSIYPAANHRNFVYALAQESGGNVIISGGFLASGGSNPAFQIAFPVPQTELVNGTLVTNGYTRDAILPRSNVARLIGGATPGPGNIQFAQNSYSASKPNNGVPTNSLFISLVRTNGNLGIIDATFSTNTAAPGPGVAGTNDLSLNPIYSTPTYTTAWRQIIDSTLPGWMYDYGVYGPNNATIPYLTANAYAYVTILNDGLITGNLSANLALSRPAGNFTLGGEVIPLGAALGGQTTVPLTIIEDNYNAGVLGFSSPNFTVTEHGGSATITVTRTNGSQNVVQVKFITSDGTATNVLDYTSVTNTLTFNAGVTSQSFSIPITPGSTVQPDKTVNLTLYSPSGGAQLGLANAVLTIINDNFSAGHISFTTANFSTNEPSGTGTALITISRLGGSSGAINVTMFTTPGSAVPGGVDYNSYSNTLSWPDRNAATITVSIPLFHDATNTSDRTVNLILTNLTLRTVLTNACWGLVTNATLTIKNVDSAGTVHFSSPIYSVKKSGGFALIPVVRTGGSIGTVSNYFTTIDGTATAPANYITTNGWLVFTNGQIGQFIHVPVIDNGASNGLKSLTVVLTNAMPPYALGSPSNATLNIIDTDSVNETPGSSDVTYDALGLNGTVYALALQGNNQLLVGGDFTMADGVPRYGIARFNSGGSLDAGFSLPSSSYGTTNSVRALAVQADGRILVGGFFTNFNSVVLNHIARLNSDGTLDSQFTPGSGPDNAVYTLAQTFVNGLPKILIGGSFATIGGTSINSIARLNSDGSLDSAFNPGLGANATVYALAVQGDGKVVLGGDFTAVNGHTNFNHIARLNTDGSVDATFNPGAGASDSVHAIAIQSDGRILIGGFFTSVNGTVLNHIARLNADGSVDGTFTPGVGASDAVFSIALQADTRIVLGGEFITCSGVNRGRITRLNPDGTVDPTINFGTGANNFVAAIAIQRDTIFGYPTNVPDEKIIIGGGFTQYNSQPHAHLARIYGGSISGVGAFEFSSADYQVDENGTNVVITVLRTGGTSGTNADASGDIIVPFTTSDGTALADVDHGSVTNYFYVTNNLDFPEGEVIQTVIIPVLDDGVITNDLTVNLALNPSPPAAFGDQPTATLTIINDDSEINFSSATYTVAKNAINGVATINIVRQGGVNGTSTVFFSTLTNGTATAGLDYYPTNVTVTFNPGVSNVLAFVPIINNGLPEGNQTVGLQLASATGSLLNSPSNAVLTIIDTAHAPGQLSFSATNYVVTEGGGVGYTNAYISVVRAFGSAGAVSAGFYTMDGTAVAGAKYIPTNGVVTFGDGETTPKTFAVQVRNTTTAEGPEYVNLFLTNATGGATLAAPTNATLTILNTNIGIAFGAAAYVTNEPSGITPGFLILSVIRFNNTNVQTLVDYSTTNGTAMAGTNFVAASGTLTFNPGDSVQTVTLTLLHDPRVTGDLAFTVGLSTNVLGGTAQLTPPSMATVILHDADAGLSFLADAMNVLNNAGFAVIVVTNTNPRVEPVSVNYSTSPGTAVPGTDYTTTSGTLTLTNGQSTGHFFVPIISNNQVQGSNRTFTVTLSAPTPPGVLVPPATETVTIVETNTPYGLSFFSPVVIGSDWGSTNVDNTGGAADSGTPDIAGIAPNSPVWVRWTAPADGEVTLDTIGSFATNGVQLDTVLSVFTGSSLGNLNQMAANDDLYPQIFNVDDQRQYNYTGQDIFNANNLPSNNAGTNILTVLPFSPVYVSYYQPYGGPSGLRFNATAGTSYYFVADSKPKLDYSHPIFLPTPPFIEYPDIGRGMVSLHWAYHPGGVFRFATEDIDQTGLHGTNGNPLLLYHASETESDWRQTGTQDIDETYITQHTYYSYETPGLLVTVTRLAGSSGRVAVDYATVDGDPNTITNGDAPAFANRDYYPEFGTLVFDDYEMSKTILIPIIDDVGLSQPNRDFTVVLSNPRRDPAESPHVSDPRVDSIFGQALCRILDCDIDPTYGASQTRVVDTNTVPATTNFVYSLVPTNAIFNFQKAHFRVPRDVNTSHFWGTTPVTVYVNRMGTNTASKSISYHINNYFTTKDPAFDQQNMYFPLQPGSDYATPFSAGSPPVNVNGRYQSTNDDYNMVGGTSGTLSWDDKKFDPKPIQFNVLNNNLTEFNEDFIIDLYDLDKNQNWIQVGMVAETTVTILFDDLSPPAGSVDEFWNPDFGVDMAIPNPIGSLVVNPGTEPLSEVYSLAVMPNNQTVIGGAFSTYSDGDNTYTVNGICRLNTDGSRDTAFNPGTGINVVPGGEFIRSVALSGNKVVIGGHFSSFNGTSRLNIARLNADGSLDTTFNPGAGANGTVWSVLVQPNGEVLMGGDFTSYNGTPRTHIALLNTDGSLDTTFDPSNTLSGPVYAMALPLSVIAGITRNALGNSNEDDQVLNLGNFTSGTLSVNYNMGIVADDMQIYYGNTNVAAGTGVLIYDTGSVTNTGTFVIPIGPTNGVNGLLTTNLITIVMDQGGLPFSTTWRYTASIAPTVLYNGILVGGLFNVAGQGYANLARLNADGSLDTTFNPGTGSDGAVWSLASQPNSQIIAGGAFTHVNGSAYNRIVRLNPDGSTAPSFFIGTGADNTVYNLTLQPDGTIYVGGAFTSFNGTHRLGFARLNSDGTVDTTFLDTAYNQFAGLSRRHFNDPPGTVYSSGIQSDGDVMIAGSFAQVGGGQFDPYCRFLDYEYDANLGVVPNGNIWFEPKARDGVRNRGNVARLVGGATPGPGNIGLAALSYAANKSQTLEAVSLVRTNGSLGYASANFSVLPGLAHSGADFYYNAVGPVYPIEWEFIGPARIIGPTSMHSDALFGGNGLMVDIVSGRVYHWGVNGPASVNVSIINNTSSSGNLSAQFQLANPVGADQFYLGGQNIPLGVALGESLAPLTIVDNGHQDGVFSFAASSYTATNSPVAVGIVRAGSSIGTVQLSYQTTTNGSTAVPGTDYQATNGVVTFNPGQTNNSFPVTVLENSYITNTEKTVTLQLYNIQDLSGGNASFGLTNALLRIINPNYQGYLNFVTNVYAANSSAGSVTITVSRTVGSKGSLTVQCATADGSAVSNVDYYCVSTNLQWNNGDVSPRTVTIPFFPNNTVGPNKMFSATLFNPTLNGTNTPSLLGAVTNTTLVIINDNSYGTFQFSAPAYLVNENGGYANVTVTRTGSALGAASVNYATADGTAFANTNYYATNGTLSFVQGQLATNFTVRILDDGVTNPPPAGFFFNVLLSSPSFGAVLGSPTNAFVHIRDAEAYNEPAGSPDVAFDSSAGMNDSVLALALQSGGQIVAGGNFTIANGTGMNHIARLNTDGTLDTGFLNGFAGANGSVNALVSQTDDRIVIGGAFSGVDGITRHRIARLMTDGSLDTSFNPGSGTDNSVFALAETFINGSRAIYIGGAFATVNGTPLSGIARLDDSGGVDASFAPGLGANGTVYAVAVYPTNSVYEAGRVLVGGAFSNFNNYVVGNLVRLNGDGSVDTNFDLNLGANGAVRAIAIQADGGILIGGDFTAVNGTPLYHIARLNNDGSLDATFAANVATSVNGIVDAIAVQADNRIVLVGDFTRANGVTRHSITRLMPDGTVDPTINFGDGANGAIDALVIQPADGMLVIGGEFTQFDDQPHQHIARLYGGSITGSGAFEFSSPTYQADENGGFAFINIRRTGGTSGTNVDGSGDVFIHFATTNGTAWAGTNYTAVVTNVDFPMGEVSETILIPVMDDFVITPNLTVNLGLSNPTPPAGIGDQATAVLTIINDDSAVSFSSAAYQIPKNTANGVATIDVIRQGSTSGGCTVAFNTTTNGTATAGVDYYPTNIFVTFNPGDSDKTVQVPIINNIIPEGNQTVTMQLTNATGTLIYAPSNATLTIIDTVQAPGQLSFATNSYSVVKGNTYVNLTVVRTAGSSGTVSADFNLIPGTATPGLNYTIPITTNVTLLGGATSNTIAIQILDNTLVQGPVSFSVVLSNPTGGATLASPTNTTVTILEKNIGLAFTAATNTVNETAGFIALNVVRLYGISNVTTVNYATTNGTAFANTNYYASSGTLTFNPGESLKAIIVPLIDDTNVTGALTFTVGLYSPSAPAQLMPPSFTTVVIQDAEAGLSFTNAAMSVLKSAGSALITVVCSNPGAEPVIVDSNTVPLSVNYATSDGTGVAGQNYTTTSGTLVFTNGIATNTFTVPILNNNSVIGDRTFNVTLSNPTPPGVLVSPSVQTVTIIDNTTGLRFSSPTYTVLKTGIAATINVFRVGYTNSTVSVDYIATNGTAVQGLNYVPTGGTLLFTNGITSQSFNVTVVNNSTVQPDVTVLLQLLNPANAILLPPSAATLTIHDNTGSYVVPAGSRLMSETNAGPANGIIDSNETVTLLFALRDAGGTNVTDLTATLLATTAITAPHANITDPPTQDYGELDYGSHSASRLFTFTAHGTNGQQIAATFLLTNNVAHAPIGTAIFGYTLGSWIATYSNTAAIIINDAVSATQPSPASPYPSIINISGLSGTVVRTTLTWTNVSHSSPSDIDALLVSPSQIDTLLMAHAGGENTITHVTLTFDDATNNPHLSQFGQITNGVYQPTRYLPVTPFR